MIPIFLAYLVLHLAGYFAWFRRLDFFGGEAGTLAYHVVPGAALTLLALLACLFDPSTVFAAFMLISLHAIYSVSVLAVWVWARDSLSADIMESLLEGSGDLSGERMAALEQRVAGKRMERLALLEPCGLVRREGEFLQLSRPGRWSAACLAFASSFSVVSRLLAALRAKALTAEQLDEELQPSQIIEGKFDALLTLRLLKPQDQGLGLTRAGLRVLSARRWLRRLLVPEAKGQGLCAPRSP